MRCTQYDRLSQQQLGFLFSHDTTPHLDLASDAKLGAVLWVTLNYASDYRTNGLYLTPNNPSPFVR